jgi:hypothetical protein
VLEIVSVKKINGRMKSETVKWLKRVKPSLTAKNEAATDKV